MALKTFAFLTLPLHLKLKMFDYVEMGPSKVDLVLYHFEGCLHLD